MKSNPSPGESDTWLAAPLGSRSVASSGGFHHMKEGPDEVSKKRQSNRPKVRSLPDESYRKLLKGAREENFEEWDQLRWLYEAGQDVAGRPIVVIVGSLAPIQADGHRLMQYVAICLDQLVQRDYVLIYIHGDMPKSHPLKFSWFRSLHKTLPRRYDQCSYSS